MAEAQTLLPADELIRLEQCAQEPIHVPGAIQPHGALLAVSLDHLEVVQVSENSAPVLGVAPDLLLGRPFGSSFGVASEATLRAALETRSSPFTVAVGGRRFDVIVHHVDRVGIAEFEPVVPSENEQSYLAALHTAARRLSTATDRAELCRLTAQEMRRLTGFDQVMVYRFHPDGHGEVVADDHQPGMTTYLGLHFPASDIPDQARRLYLIKGSGLIASSDYQPAVLRPVLNPRTGAPLDLTRAELRSVSPVHLTFMRNMGQGASLTLSLVLDGHLLGLITCAHRSPRYIPILLRRTCEILAQQVALQIEGMSRTQKLTREMRLRDVRKVLTHQMSADLDVRAGLVEGKATVLDLVKADGATVYQHRQMSSVGHTPSHSQTAALVDALTQTTPDTPLFDNASLPVDRPDLAHLVPEFVGLLVLRFGTTGDCVIWFRSEVTQTVDWLGEQSPANRNTTLAPRSSFDRWRQTVTGHCVAWDSAELAEAAELGRDIEQILLRQADAQLVYLGRHDPLTGLPNRAVLIDNITSAVARADRHGDRVAILFCDLDDFKRVNDTGGHAAGDAVLIEAAARLSAELRSEDSIARVGGDEFVIILEPTRNRVAWTVMPGTADRDVPGPADIRQSVRGIADRIQAALSRPIYYQGHEHLISVSVGMTIAGPGSRAEDLLRDADTAMYRAKRAGKNRAEIFDDSLRTDILDREAAEPALRAALTADNRRLSCLDVTYQPVFDLASGRPVSFEALARLTDADGRSIPREVFYPVAEHSGFIDALDDAVLAAASAALTRWRAEHRDTPMATLAVRLGIRQTPQADTVARVQAAVRRAGLEPSDLTVQLSETVLAEANVPTLRLLNDLHAAGVGIAIDDFGVRYASVRHLSVAPVTTLKVDRSLTAGLPDDAASVTTVQAIAALAANMGLACIFGGIDNERQLTALPPGVLGQGLLLGGPTDTPTAQPPSVLAR